jgi:hypothetical protein
VIFSPAGTDDEIRVEIELEHIQNRLINPATFVQHRLPPKDHDKHTYFRENRIPGIFPSDQSLMILTLKRFESNLYLMKNRSLCTFILFLSLTILTLPSGAENRPFPIEIAEDYVWNSFDTNQANNNWRHGWFGWLYKDKSYPDIQKDNGTWFITARSNEFKSWIVIDQEKDSVAYSGGWSGGAYIWSQFFGWGYFNPNSYDITSGAVWEHFYSFDWGTTASLSGFGSDYQDLYHQGDQTWIRNIPYNISYDAGQSSNPNDYLLYGDHGFWDTQGLPSFSINSTSAQVTRKLVDMFGWIKNTGGEAGINFISDGINHVAYFGESSTTAWHIPYSIIDSELPNYEDGHIWHYDFQELKWEWGFPGDYFLMQRFMDAVRWDKNLLDSDLQNDTHNDSLLPPSRYNTILSSSKLATLRGLIGLGGYETIISDDWFNNNQEINFNRWNLYGANFVSLHEATLSVDYKNENPGNVHQWMAQYGGLPINGGAYSDGSITKGPVFATTNATHNVLLYDEPLIQPDESDIWRNRWQLGIVDRTDPNVVNDPEPWLRNYNALFDVALVNVAGQNKVIAAVHGENVPGYAIAGDEDYRINGTVRPYTAPFAEARYDGFIYNGGTNYNPGFSWNYYGAFVSVAHLNWTPPNFGMGTFTNIGPVVWPNPGYLESDGFNRIIGGLRNPSIIEKDSYIYVFYKENGSGVKVARAPKANYLDPMAYKVYTGELLPSNPNPSDYWARSLPDGFNKNNISAFYHTPAKHKSATIIPYANEPLYSSLDTDTWAVDVAKISQLIDSKQYYLMMEFSKVSGVISADLFVVSFRLSEDLVNWTAALPVTTHCYQWTNQYPKFCNANGEDSEVVDLDNFYTIGKFGADYTVMHYQNVFSVEN